MLEHKIVCNRYDGARTQINDTESPEFEARLAVQLLEKWGPVLADTDGEDSAGRQKMRVLSPSEIVDKACSIASLAATEFRARGWMHITPSLAELDAAEKEQKKEKETA